MRKLLVILFCFIFSKTAYASYISDLDYPLPEKLIECQPWRQVDCDGGSYLFLPTVQEWVSWGYDIEDYQYLEPEDAIFTEHYEVNTWEMSYADRFAKCMFNLPKYNLVAFLTMYNELIPYQPISAGDKDLKFNYPFDIREYSWEQMNFNEIDWRTQKHWLELREYIKEPEEQDEFLYTTNIPKTVSIFQNKNPASWQLPASPSDWGLIGRIVNPIRNVNSAKTYLENDKNYFLLPETRKDISYFEVKRPTSFHWENQPYSMWRYAPYASRWYFADIVNAVAGELNYRWVGGSKYEYKDIPVYFFNIKNVIMPIKEATDIYDGIELAYKYCKVMECTNFSTSPNKEHSRTILKYLMEIKALLNKSEGQPFKFMPYMAEDTRAVKEKIEKKEKVKISDSTWYFTIAYIVNSNGLEGYMIEK